jgi:hypothetical protein
MFILLGAPLINKAQNERVALGIPRHSTCLMLRVSDLLPAEKIPFSHCIHEG